MNNRTSTRSAQHQPSPIRLPRGGFRRIVFRYSRNRLQEQQPAAGVQRITFLLLQFNLDYEKCVILNLKQHSCSSQTYRRAAVRDKDIADAGLTLIVLRMCDVQITCAFNRPQFCSRQSPKKINYTAETIEDQISDKSDNFAFARTARYRKSAESGKEQ